MGTESDHLVAVFPGWGIVFGNSGGSTAIVLCIEPEGTSCANARSQRHPSVIAGSSDGLRSVAALIPQRDAATG